MHTQRRRAGARATTLTLPATPGARWHEARAEDLDLPVTPGSLGRFLLLGELGRGAMSVVYEALEPSGRRIALKLASTAKGVRALTREARILARVGPHPDLVGLRECASTAGRVAVALDLVQGQALDLLLRSGPLPPVVAARALAPVARALAHLHVQGVVHRDVKPANVIVRPDGRGVLTDLGLARARDDQERPGHTAGTPAYMPAELLCGARPSATGDVFALGVSLYEALTGHVPHDAPSRESLLALRCRRPIMRPSQELPLLPRRLDDLVVACLAPKPRDRPSAGRVALILSSLAEPARGGIPTRGVRVA